MKRTDKLRLDRALTEAPSELHDSIEEAFERGEKAMKKRHKIMTALSVAAACAALFAGLALAAGQLTRPRPDNIVAARSPEGEGTDFAAITPEPTPLPALTATPEITPEPTPLPALTATPEPEITLVYTRPNSNYYHADPNCSGMEDAVAWTLESAISVGKQPCPMCLADEEEAPLPADSMAEAYEAPIYYTEQGAYYHGDAQCSGMQNAGVHTLAEAEAAGKARCPACQPGEPDHYDLFTAAFGQALEDLIPGYAYACYSNTKGSFGDKSWWVTNGESDRIACDVGSFLLADGGDSRVDNAVGATLEDVICFTFDPSALENLWPFLSKTEAGETARVRLDEAVEEALEAAAIETPVNLTEESVWVAVGSDGQIKALDVVFVDRDVANDVAVVVSYQLEGDAYVENYLVNS